MLKKMGLFRRKSSTKSVTSGLSAKLRKDPPPTPAPPFPPPPPLQTPNHHQSHQSHHHQHNNPPQTPLGGSSSDSSPSNGQSTPLSTFSSFATTDPQNSRSTVTLPSSIDDQDFGGPTNGYFIDQRGNKGGVYGATTAAAIGAGSNSHSQNVNGRPVGANGGGIIIDNYDDITNEDDGDGGSTTASSIYRTKSAPSQRPIRKKLEKRGSKGGAAVIGGESREGAGTSAGVSGQSGVLPSQERQISRRPLTASSQVAAESVEFRQSETTITLQGTPPHQRQQHYQQQTPHIQTQTQPPLSPPSFAQGGVGGGNGGGNGGVGGVVTTTGTGVVGGAGVTSTSSSPVVPQGNANNNNTTTSTNGSSNNSNGSNGSSSHLPSEWRDREPSVFSRFTHSPTPSESASMQYAHSIASNHTTPRPHQYNNGNRNNSSSPVHSLNNNNNNVNGINNSNSNNNNNNNSLHSNKNDHLSPDHHHYNNRHPNNNHSQHPPPPHHPPHNQHQGRGGINNNNNNNNNRPHPHNQPRHNNYNNNNNLHPNDPQRSRYPPGQQQQHPPHHRPFNNNSNPRHHVPPVPPLPPGVRSNSFSSFRREHHPRQLSTVVENSFPPVNGRSRPSLRSKYPPSAMPPMQVNNGHAARPNGGMGPSPSSSSPQKKKVPATPGPSSMIIHFTPSQLNCLLKHKDLKTTGNFHHPTPCMICRRLSSENMLYCSWCSLRICRPCSNKLHKEWNGDITKGWGAVEVFDADEQLQVQQEEIPFEHRRPATSHGSAEYVVRWGVNSRPGTANTMNSVSSFNSTVSLPMSQTIQKVNHFFNGSISRPGSSRMRPSTGNRPSPLNPLQTNNLNAPRPPPGGNVKGNKPEFGIDISFDNGDDGQAIESSPELVHPMPTHYNVNSLLNSTSSVSPQSSAAAVTTDSNQSPVSPVGSGSSLPRRMSHSRVASGGSVVSSVATASQDKVDIITELAAEPKGKRKGLKGMFGRK